MVELGKRHYVAMPIIPGNEFRVTFRRLEGILRTETINTATRFRVVAQIACMRFVPRRSERARLRTSTSLRVYFW